MTKDILILIPKIEDLLGHKSIEFSSNSRKNLFVSMTGILERNSFLIFNRNESFGLKDWVDLTILFKKLTEKTDWSHVNLGIHRSPNLNLSEFLIRHCPISKQKKLIFLRCKPTNVFDFIEMLGKQETNYYILFFDNEL